MADFVPESHWLNDLKPLAGVAGTLVTVATNPEAWLRGHVFKLIAEWLVAQIIGGVQFVLGWLLFGAERTASIIVGAAGPFSSPIVILGDAVVRAINALYGAALGVAHSAGLAGPPAAAFAVAVLSAVLAAVLYAVVKVIPGSDALEGGLEALR